MLDLYSIGVGHHIPTLSNILATSSSQRPPQKLGKSPLKTAKISIKIKIKMPNIKF